VGGGACCRRASSLPLTLSRERAREREREREREERERVQTPYTCALCVCVVYWNSQKSFQDKGAFARSNIYRLSEFIHCVSRARMRLEAEPCVLRFARSNAPRSRALRAWPCAASGVQNALFVIANNKASTPPPSSSSSSPPPQACFLSLPPADPPARPLISSILPPSVATYLGAGFACDPVICSPNATSDAPFLIVATASL